jgi:competence protein ComEA
MQSHLIFSLITKPIIVISIILSACIGICCGCGRDGAEERFTETEYAQGSHVLKNEKSASSVTSEQAAPSSICVFVCGAVEREGVYTLTDGSRVIDAVRAAGGFSADADQNYVNLAEYVYDTQRIEIPTLAETEQIQANSGQGLSAGNTRDYEGRININHAAKKELMELPGIGESKADRIIAYRQAHGDFTSCEEVMNVSGIGEAMFDNIKDLITVN